MAGPVFGRVLISYFVTPHPRSEVFPAIFIMMLRIVFISPATVADYFFYAIVAAFNHFFMRVARWCFLGAVALEVSLCKPFRLSVVRHDQLL